MNSGLQDLAQVQREQRDWWLQPLLLEEVCLIRNVLRAVGGLPSRSPAEAGATLAHHLLEMDFAAARDRTTAGRAGSVVATRLETSKKGQEQDR